MSNELKWYRDPQTGKSAQYPDAFVRLFPTLEEIPSSDAGCLDCVLVSEPDTDVTPDDFTDEDDVFEDEVFDDNAKDDD